MPATQISVDVTDAMLDSVSLVRDILKESGYGHQIVISAPSEWDDREEGLYVTGYRIAGMDRLAWCGPYGEMEWLR